MGYSINRLKLQCVGPIAMLTTDARAYLLWVGFGLWVVSFLCSFTTFYDHQWARDLLTLAALVYVPLAWPLLRNRAEMAFLMLVAAVLFTVSMWLPVGWIAALFAFPWLACSVWIFQQGFIHLLLNPRRPSILATGAAQMFLVVGGMWAMADRLGWQPLGFDPAIVLLTAVHFHYAGFVFPLLLGLAGARWPRSVALHYAAFLAVFSIILTAAGITLAQVYHTYALEVVAAAMVAVAGWLGALAYVRVVLFERLPTITRICWSVLAFSLAGSMTLAFLYALRPYMPLDFLTIPNMRAWHGTMNAFGVAGCGLLGWHVYRTMALPR